ncbi:MAG: L-threonylcarbamoyladenylate synthase [Casimicrobiaceae bacterium]
MILPATPAALAAAAQALRDGTLVAFPTETVYGLGADARNPDALRRLFAAKRRPAEHPVIVHVASKSAVMRWARALPEYAELLADAFWPGPLTLILPRADDVADQVTGGQRSVGVRIPAHPLAQALLTAFAERGGDGIAAPSANRFGRISATTAQHVADDFGEDVALIVDGGPCAHGLESTIVDCTRVEPALLRPGAISIAEITRVLGKPPSAPSEQSPRASGTLARHYAPQTRSRLLARDALDDALAHLRRPGAHIAVLAHSIAQPPAFEGTWFDAPTESALYAHQLYSNLRALDARAADEIWIETPPDGPDWIAINDRLRRATHRD